jgi:alpha-D-ribose 1-methylphosphonate 5-triphosphate synthase subunit PhnL
MTPLVRVEGVRKGFTLHLRGGARLGVLACAHLEVRPGECVALGGPSGSGKSSLLRMIAGNYRCDAGRILVRDGDEVVDVAAARPRRVLALRRTVIGWVSQFLRAIPRVGALDLVAAAGREGGMAPDAAEMRARELLARLNLPERLWSLPPATFSGGEQQRVNVARGFAADRPVLLLDEPTASLDAANRDAVLALVRERVAAGAAVIGIFHDAAARESLAARVVDVSRFAPGGDAA